ncbi:MAG: hypothetical protein J5367_07375 [Lachnospiraceae bacterium]|nr:hypothetical protein [Lachnospiraceae bacterium]
MQGVNVFENGIGYLHKCLELYNGGTGFLVMYLLAVLFILIKGSERDRKIFLPGAVMLLVTVYNPIVPVIVDRIFDVSSEYYRLFWIAPVIVLVPLVAVELIESARTGSAKLITTLIIAAAFVLGGNFVYGKGLDIAENIYKIPNELIEISDMIHADSGTEYTRAFFEYEYNMEIRQYDPKMLLCVDREDYIYAVNYSYTDDMLGEDAPPVNVILALLVRNQKVDPEAFLNALDATGTQYVVLTKGHPQIRTVRNAGLYEVGRTATHIVLKYDLKEPADYSLVDYSQAEHRFSTRRLK